jgi:hypothetical protein
MVRTSLWAEKEGSCPMAEVLIQIQSHMAWFLWAAKNIQLECTEGSLGGLTCYCY